MVSLSEHWESISAQRPITTLQKRLQKALLEDGFEEDITTLSLGEEYYTAPLHAQIIWKQDGIFCGSIVLDTLQTIFAEKVHITPLIQDGKWVSNGGIVATLQGEARTILSLERVALNCIQKLSGIATLTHKMVQDLESPTRLYDTRKTSPLWRDIEKYAVLSGGGHSHRFNLSSQILIKENHIFVIQNQTQWSRLQCIEYILSQVQKESIIEIEIETVEEAKVALLGGAHIILCDNMSPNQVSQIIQLRQKFQKSHIQLEVSGNITPKSIQQWVPLKVDRISSGYMIHSARYLDCSMLFSKVP